MRSTRAFSGSYWEIAEPTPRGISALVRSRSLLDQALPPPPGGVAALATHLGRPIYYDVAGPQKTHLRTVALMALVQNRTEPLIFMAARTARRSISRCAISASVRRCSWWRWARAWCWRWCCRCGWACGRCSVWGERSPTCAWASPTRLSEAYPTELAPLAHEMNALVAHNQEVVERQRTHVGNLAHALKTPLAVITSEAEHKSPSGRGGHASGHGDARPGRPPPAPRPGRRARPEVAASGTPVAPALDELARTLERIFQDKGVVIDWRALPNLMFRGERQDLLEIAGNVLENACKWCRKSVEIDAALVAPGLMRLTVEDDGPGLPDEQRDEVLQRGARLDESAPGSGLGLSIVDELARAYGGKVAMDRSSLGGLKVIIDLPAAEG